MTTNSFSLQTIERLDNTEDVLKLREAINTAIVESKEIESILTSLDVEKASHYSKGFSKIIKQAEALRKLEKEPYAQAAKDVDNFFKSLIINAQAEMERLDKHILNWTKEQQRIAKDKADEEKKAAEDKALSEGIEKEKKMKEVREQQILFLKSSFEKDNSLDNVLLKCKTELNIIINQDEINFITGTTEELKVETPKVEVAIVPETVVEPPKLSQKNTSGVGTMKVAKWRVIDESLIPKKYWVLNESMITAERKAAGAENCVSTIPGIEFYFEETLQKR